MSKDYERKGKKARAIPSTFFIVPLSLYLFFFLFYGIFSNLIFSLPSQRCVRAFCVILTFGTPRPGPGKKDEQFSADVHNAEKQTTRSTVRFAASRRPNRIRRKSHYYLYEAKAEHKKRKEHTPH